MVLHIELPTLGADEMRCELLSNLYLCMVLHIPMRKPRKFNRVVNCFQICIFAWYYTSNTILVSSLLEL